MGHYRSEMGYEDEDERERKHRAEQRERILRNVRKQIDEQGAEAVIADLLLALLESRVYVHQKWDRE